MTPPHSLDDLLNEEQQQQIADVLSPLLTIDYSAELSRLLKPAHFSLVIEALMDLRKDYGHGSVEIVVRDGYVAGVNETRRRK